MRRSASSRPSSATLSKIPGEIVVPAIATRTGWKTCFGFQPRASTSAAQRRLDRLLRERLADRGQRLARGGERLRPALGADRLAPTRPASSTGPS